LTSDVRWHARSLFVLLLVFALAVSGLNVVNSYVNRDFMTAVANRDAAGFTRQAVRYVAVFAVSSLVAVMYRFTEERLGLLWRTWLTRVLTRAYLADRTYFRLKSVEGVDNPDQRIADDTRAFTATAISFSLMSLNGLLAVISFSGVLWTISPPLFGVAVGYAALGTAGAVLLGRPLVALNVRQSDAEADFRAELVHVRENAESVALARHEGRLLARLLRCIGRFADNFRRITSVNRNLGFFTTGYNYMIQIIPAVVVGPAFIRGEVEFGVITQSSVVFAQLVGAFSLIITQFQSISAFAAVVTRLSALVQEVERARPAADEDQVNGFVLDKLCVRSADGRPLVSDLSLTFPARSQVLIAAADDATLHGLVCVVGGLHEPAGGRVTRPPAREFLIVTERPYFPAGSLREVLVPSDQDAATPDAAIDSALGALGIADMATRFGGLDREHHWGSELSLRELHLLALARVLLARPQFALLDRVDSTLGTDGFRHALGCLRHLGIGCIALGVRVGYVEWFDVIVDIRADGTWERHSGQSETLQR